MSRAALLPHPADPFMLNYWLRLFETVWGDEVDRLYVLVNSPIEADVVAYMKERMFKNRKIRFQFVDKQIEHGDGIDMLLDMCLDEYIMLVEDDGLIFKSGYVDKHFSLVESGQYDILGSPRGSCAMEIWNEAQKLWGLDHSGHGDVGPNFWPCYFFSKKQVLIDTDRNFKARAWKKDEVVEPLNYVVQPEIIAGDTFVNTSLQLRAKGYKIATIPQYHGSPDDIKHYDNGYNLFDGQAWWTHIGSLSSGTHGVLKDDYGRMLARRKIDPPVPNFRFENKDLSEQEKQEWERRVQWWLTFYQNREHGKIDEFAAEYLKAIERIIKAFGLSMSNIERRQKIYRTIGL